MNNWSWFPITQQRPIKNNWLASSQSINLFSKCISKAFKIRLCLSPESQIDWCSSVVRHVLGAHWPLITLVLVLTSNSDNQIYTWSIIFIITWLDNALKYSKTLLIDISANYWFTSMYKFQYKNENFLQKQYLYIDA